MAEPKVKYDRQLRIWGEQGQAALEKSSICLLNCGPTGSETLKNLVLGGIGSITVVDGSKVEEGDLGNNFMVDESSIGQSKAKCVCSFLQELNDAVKAKFIEEYPEELIETNPSFFSQFTLVVATQLVEDSMVKLDRICRGANVMLIFARSYGLTGFVRISLKVEPSPTTGSLTKPLSVQESVCPATYPVTTAPTDFNSHVNEPSMQTQGSSQAQSSASSPLVKSEMAMPSNELSLSSPVQMVCSDATALVQADMDGSNPRGNVANGLQASQVEVKDSGISVAERTSDDGYNWRKYGQKHVKGSEFPRCYYKCTHPNCEVKKLFERSHDGQITEIIYKGSHDHPKPQPSRRYSSGTIMSMHEERFEKPSSLSGQDVNMYGQVSHTTEPNSNPELSVVAASDDGREGAGLASNRINDEVDDDDPFSKRRKMENGNADITPIVKPIREPRVVVQTLSEVDILDDGYRWRKYGQKVVRGNPNPRSYYKCTNAGCPVRKHVERASHDPKAVITTYEGKHNHDVPTARSSSHDTAGPAAPVGQTRIRSEESDTISLDLGMGISSAAENKLKGQGQMLLSEFGNDQTHSNSSNFKFVHNAPAPAYFGVLNNGSNPFGSSREPSSLNHTTYRCPQPQGIGRILTGP